MQGNENIFEISLIISFNAFFVIPIKLMAFALGMQTKAETSVSRWEGGILSAFQAQQPELLDKPQGTVCVEKENDDLGRREGSKKTQTARWEFFSIKWVFKILWLLRMLKEKCHVRILKDKCCFGKR